MFSYYRMCSLTIECVLLLLLTRMRELMDMLLSLCLTHMSLLLSYTHVFTTVFTTSHQDEGANGHAAGGGGGFGGTLQVYRMCSLTTECVLLLSNVFSYYFSYCFGAPLLSRHPRMCSLTIECVLILLMVALGERYSHVIRSRSDTIWVQDFPRSLLLSYTHVFTTVFTTHPLAL